MAGITDQQRNCRFPSAHTYTFVVELFQMYLFGFQSSDAVRMERSDSARPAESEEKRGKEKKNEQSGQSIEGQSKSTPDRLASTLRR